MDHRTDVREFLRSRRARVTPEQAGLLAGRNRRVPGLRREEVALVAGVSVDYYARLERGDLSGVSEEVLDALARALLLDEAETAHLHALARAASHGGPRRRRSRVPTAVRPGLQRFLDSVSAPAWVRNERMDFIATNALARALYAPILEQARTPANNARFVFLDEAVSREFYPDWEQGASEVVASLRSYAGKNPHDFELTALVGELATQSDAFRTRWASYDVRFHRTGAKRLHHPVVGDLELAFEALELPADPGWTMYAYSAEPGSASDERLRLLASWAASADVTIRST